MKIFKRQQKQNPCENCKCEECEQNCNPNINDYPYCEIVAMDIMYEQSNGCPYGVKKKRKKRK